MDARVIRPPCLKAAPDRSLTHPPGSAPPKPIRPDRDPDLIPEAPSRDSPVPGCGRPVPCGLPVPGLGLAGRRPPGVSVRTPTLGHAAPGILHGHGGRLRGVRPADDLLVEPLPCGRHPPVVRSVAVPRGLPPDGEPRRGPVGHWLGSAPDAGALVRHRIPAQRGVVAALRLVHGRRVLACRAGTASPATPGNLRARIRPGLGRCPGGDTAADR